jgi:hypothetical protein
MTKTALITGITGQDGSYLAEFLLEKGYEVHGLMRRSSSFNTGRIEHLYLDEWVRDMHQKRLINLHYADMTDSSSLIRIIQTIKPDEIYNLAAQSHVKVSFDVPEYTAEVDAATVVQTPNGNIYTLKPDISELLPNKRIICSYKLTPKTVVVIPGGITISPWEDISEETIHEVEPDDTEATIPAESDKSYTGDGTSDFPYSVAEAISNQGDTEVWVKGYIVGFADYYNSETYELSNKIVKTNSTESIVLADIPTEEDITKMLPVKFGVGSDAKDRLNWKNEDAQGREVMILCNLEEVYNSPGGNNITDYKLI